MTFDQFENARLAVAVGDGSDGRDQRIQLIQISPNNNQGEGAGIGLIMRTEGNEERTVLKLSIRDALMIADEIRATCGDAVVKWNDSTLGHNNRVDLSMILASLGMAERRAE